MVSLGMTDRKYVVLVIAVLIASALGVLAVVLPGLNNVSTKGPPTITLPAGCVKPPGGFLIIADQLGFNDSIEHGVPENNWPVMNVQQGQNVTIVVCNADPAQTHGFQVDHYYDARLVAIQSGHVLKVSFITNETGSFRVYCSIYCTVHWAMQSGELVVS
jgi:heme/copper-type cytochrome/quinol oxidase subunit 2